MKVIYIFPALVIAATIFSGACQKNDLPGPGKKGSSPSIPAAPATGSKEKTEVETRIDHVSAIQAAETLKQNADTLVIDVRTPDEYAVGHIKASINIDFKADSFADELKKLDPTKTYLVHCRSGGRSTSALDTFEKLGFHHVIHLDGGMMDWGKEQLPVEK